MVHYHRYPKGYEGLVRYWHDYRPDDVVACPSELGWLLPVASTFLYALSRGLSVVLYDAMGGKFDAGPLVRAVPGLSHHQLHSPADTYRMLTAAGEAADGSTSPAGGTPQARASRCPPTRWKRSAAVRHHADRRHRHDRVHGLLFQSRRHATQAGKLRTARGRGR